MLQGNDENMIISQTEVRLKRRTNAACTCRKGCMLFECVCYLSKHRPDICFNRHKYNVLHTKIALCVFVYTHTNK